MQPHAGSPSVFNGNPSSHGPVVAVICWSQLAKICFASGTPDFANASVRYYLLNLLKTIDFFKKKCRLWFGPIIYNIFSTLAALRMFTFSSLRVPKMHVGLVLPLLRSTDATLDPV